MDHGLKGGGREGAGKKEQSIIVVACISLDFLLLARLPRWIDTKIGSGITEGFYDATKEADSATDALRFGKECQQ